MMQTPMVITTATGLRISRRISRLKIWNALFTPLHLSPEYLNSANSLHCKQAGRTEPAHLSVGAEIYPIG